MKRKKKPGSSRKRMTPEVRAALKRWALQVQLMSKFLGEWNRVFEAEVGRLGRALRQIEADFARLEHKAPEEKK